MSQLNLRTILAGDDISQVVEKINANFQQITLNGGGPIGDPGLIGPPGIPGGDGPTGPAGGTGPDGTHVFTGLTAPNLVTWLVPTPKLDDIFIETSDSTGTINFWDKGTTGATGWNLIASVNASDGVFSTVKQISDGGIPATTAAYTKTSKASKLLIGDSVAMSTDNHLLLDVSGTKKLANWLDQSLIEWGAMFAGLSNQIRLLNTDPAISGSGAYATRSITGAGTLLSLNTVTDSSNQVMRIFSANTVVGSDQNSNTFFSLGLCGDGTTVALFTDLANRVAVNTDFDPLSARNTSLDESFTVFGSQLVHDVTSSSLRIDTDISSGTSSKLFISRGKFEDLLSTGSEWKVTLDDTNTLQLSSTIGIKTSDVINFNIASITDRTKYTPKISIGGTNAIAEVEIGTHISGRLGFGQLNPSGLNNFAAGYMSYNAFRERNAQWTLRGDGSKNGGGVSWSSSDGKTWSFLLMPSTGGADRLITDDAFLKTESSVTMKRIGSGFAKMFIDSFGYTDLGDAYVTAAPHLIIGTDPTSNAALFNFGQQAEGIGLHGAAKGIEWTTGQVGSTVSGFRIKPNTQIVNGLNLTTQNLQYRSYDDTEWRNSITIISQNNKKAGLYSGNVVVGTTAVSLNVGSAKFTVVGNTGPTGDATSLNSPNIVDFQTSEGVSSFKIDKDGNIISGVKFGSTLYNSTDVHTLDHYEEGTWTPVLSIDTPVPEWNSSVYKVYKSKYTRIGNKVKVDFTIKVSTASSIPGTTGRSLYIAGFPYKPDFENVTGIGATTTNSLTPCYPLVPLKAIGLTDNSGLAIGAVSAYAGDTSSIPQGWVACNGQDLSRTDYSSLFTKIGTTYGTTNNLTFKAPDLRGYFIRGLDMGAGIDSGRALGTIQIDEIKAHTHGTGVTSSNNNYGGGSGSGTVRTSSGPIQTSSVGGSETRPKNVAMNYIIYVGQIGNSNNVIDLSGGFVLYNGVNTRLYLYDSLSSLNVDDLPYGVNVNSTLFGSFEYFVSSVPAIPIITPVSKNATIGDTSFSIPLSILSDSPISNVSISGMPSWMKYVSGTRTITFNNAVTSVPTPEQTYNLTATATNSDGSSSASITVNVYILAPPVISGPSTHYHPYGSISTIEYTATGSPTLWEITPALPIGATLTYSGSGATVTISSTCFIDDDTYTISASNLSGIGTKNTLIQPLVSYVPLYWELNGEWIADPFDYADVTIRVYDELTGGTLLATGGGHVTNAFAQTGSFSPVYLINGETYYAEAVMQVSVPAVDSWLNEGAETVPMNVETGPPNEYSSDGRISFTYSTLTPNTILVHIKTIT